jgi:hypothetical protein
MILEIFRIGGEYYNEPAGIDWAKWIGVLFSGVTLYIAYKIYRSFDVSKKIKEKQLTIVFDLVKAIQSTSVVFQVKGHGERRISHEIAFSHVHSTIDNPSMKENFKNINVKWDYNAFMLPFTEFTDNPFLPISIAKELKPLSIWFYTARDENDVLIDDQNYVMFFIDGDQEDYYNTQGQTHINKSVKFKTVGEYIKQVIKVYSAIDAWLKIHGADDLNIRVDKL